MQRSDLNDRCPPPSSPSPPPRSLLQASLEAQAALATTAQARAAKLDHSMVRIEAEMRELSERYEGDEEDHHRVTITIIIIVMGGTGGWRRCRRRLWCAPLDAVLLLLVVGASCCLVAVARRRVGRLGAGRDDHHVTDGVAEQTNKRLGSSNDA